MRINELAQGKQVKWICIDGPDELKGTKLRFDLISNAEGGTILRVKNAGWRSRKGAFGMCNMTWGALKIRLKECAEGKRSDLFFSV